MIIRELITKWGFEIDDTPLKKADAGVKTLTLSIAAMTVALGGATAALGFFLKKGGELEQTNIAFETMLGSAEKGKQLFADLAKFTKATPFELKDTLIGAKRLLAYNIEAEKIIPTLTALGNIAAGVGREKLPFLILALGQVRTATKLRGQELRQFSEAGVPLIAALAEKFGKAESEIASMVSRGEVGFKDVEEAIIAMTSGTGKFADLMQKQSKSFLGILSIIRDTLNIIAIEIGSSILPMGKKYAKMVLDWVNANEKLIKLKMVTFFQKVFKVLEKVIRILRQMFRTVMTLINAIGGLNKVMTNTAKLMGIVFSLAVVASIGKIVSSVFSLIFALKKMGIVGLIANLKVFAIPLLIGAAFIALLSILDEFINFAKGNGTVMEDFMKTFAKPEQIERFREAVVKLVKTSKELAGSIFDAIGRLFGAGGDDKVDKSLDKRQQRLETFINLMEQAVTLVERLNNLMQPGKDGDIVDAKVFDPVTGKRFEVRAPSPAIDLLESTSSGVVPGNKAAALRSLRKDAEGSPLGKLNKLVQDAFSKNVITGQPNLGPTEVNVNVKTDANPQEIAEEVEKVIVKQNREAKRDTAGIVSQ